MKMPPHWFTFAIAAVIFLTATFLTNSTLSNNYSIAAFPGGNNFVGGALPVLNEPCLKIISVSENYLNLKNCGNKDLSSFKVLVDAEDVNVRKNDGSWGLSSDLILRRGATGKLQFARPFSRGLQKITVQTNYVRASGQAAAYLNAFDLQFEGGFKTKNGEPPISNVNVALAAGKYGAGADIGANSRLVYGIDGFDWESGSIDLWVKPEWDGNLQPQETHRFLTAYSQNNYRDYIVLEARDGRLRFTVSSASGLNQEANLPLSSANFRADEWHNIAANWQLGGGITLYLDGRAAGRGRMQYDLGAKPSFIAIGDWIDPSGKAEAVIDEVKIAGDLQVCGSYDKPVVPQPDSVKIDINFSREAGKIDSIYGLNEQEFMRYFRDSTAIQNYHSAIAGNNIRLFISDNVDGIYNDNNAPYDCREWNFIKLDGYVKAILNSFAAPYLVFREPVDCMSVGGVSSEKTMPSDFNAFAAYTAEIVKHYREACTSGAIDCSNAPFTEWHWQIWNEPGDPKFWGGNDGNYTRIFNKAYVAIKQVAPEAKVGGFGLYVLSDDNYYEDELDRFLSAAAGIDFLSLHHYGNTAGAVECPGEEFLYINYTRKEYFDDTRRIRQKLDSIRPGEKVQIMIDELNPSSVQQHDWDQKPAGAAWFASALNWIVRNPNSGAIYHDATGAEGLYSYGMWAYPSLKTYPVYDMFKQFSKINMQGSAIFSSTENQFVEVLPIKNYLNGFAITAINKMNKTVELNLTAMGGPNFNAKYQLQPYEVRFILPDASE